MSGDKLKLNRIAEEFEAAWSRRETPELSEFLNRVDATHRFALAELLLPTDLEYRFKIGETPSLDDYRPLGSDVVELVVKLLADETFALRCVKQSDEGAIKRAAGSAQASDEQATQNHSRADFPKSRTIGPYKLLQEIGEGGMGSVWMAQQEAPVRRRVALKLIKAGLDSKQVVARFEAERQALAMMNHQNIAMVLDAGTTVEGLPYFVMELVQGIPFNKYCDTNKLTIRERLDLFIPICEAVQHAHQKGIIHRDIKPANVLVTLYDGKPVPKIIDFGLAKALQHQTRLTDKTMFTEFGQVVGTLQYMSPEQAEMNALDIDTRTDIYSLGVMLYELLTGSTPIEKETVQKEVVHKVLESIREKEPPRPSHRLSSSGDAITGISQQRKIEPKKLHQILRGDLDWIVMKAIEKDRSRRYETANGLGADITRYLSNESITARPPTPAYRIQKFVQKNKGLVASLATIASVLLAAIVGSTWFGFAANNSRAAAVLSERKAVNEKSEADAQRVRANVEAKNAIREKAIAANQRDEANRQRIAAENAETKSAKLAYLAQISVAESEWESGSPSTAFEALAKCAWPLRDWEHNYLSTQLTKNQTKLIGHAGSVNSVVFSPDGKRVATGSDDHSVKIWDASTGQEVMTLTADSKEVNGVVYFPDGSKLVSVSGNIARIWDAKTGKLIGSVSARDQIGCVACSPDGLGFACGGWDGSITFWDSTTLQVRATTSVKSHYWHSLVYSPDGTKVATSTSGYVLVSDVETGARVASFDCANTNVLFSSDGTEIFGLDFEDNDIRICCWNALTGEKVNHAKTGFGNIESRMGLFGMSFNGDKFVAVGKSSLQLFDASKYPFLVLSEDLKGHFDSICDIAFSPNGTQLVFGGLDKLAVIWNLAESTKDFVRLDSDGGGIVDNQIAISSDLSKVVKRDQYDSWDVWNAKTGQKKATFERIESDWQGSQFVLAFVRDGKELFVPSDAGDLAIWDVESERIARTTNAKIDQFVSYFQDRTKAFTHDGFSVSCWDTSLGTCLYTIPGFAFDVSYDGTGVAIGKKNVLVLYGAETGKHIRDFSETDSDIETVAFSRGGKNLVTAHRDNSIRTWDVETGTQLKVIARKTSAISYVGYSPNDSCIVSVDGSKEPEIWDADSGAHLRTLPAQISLTSNDNEIKKRGYGGDPVLFSPDGKWVVCDDGKLFDAVKWVEIGLVGQNANAISISPDSRQIAVGETDGTIRVFSIANPKELASRKLGNYNFSSLAYSPDGAQLAGIIRNSTERTNSLIVVDASSLKDLLRIEIGGGHAESISFSPDGKWLVGRRNQERIGVFDSSSGKLFKNLGGDLVGFTGTRIAYSHDDRFICIDGWRDGCLAKIVNADSGEVVRSLSIGPEDQLDVNDSNTNCIEFSPDDKAVVLGCEDGNLRKWEVRNGAHGLTFKGHLGPVLCAAFSPDGSWIASGSRDKTVGLWDSRTGKLQHVLSGHLGDVTCIAFSPDGHFLASGNQDETLRLWDATTGRFLRSLVGHNKPIRSVAFSANGLRIVSADEKGNTRIWDPEVGATTIQLSGETHLSFARVLFCKDNLAIVSVSDDGIKWWDASNPAKMGKKEADGINASAWELTNEPNQSVRSMNSQVDEMRIVCKYHACAEYFLTLGASEYRAGRFAEAITSLDPSMTLSENAKSNVEALAYGAMSHYKLGHLDQANDLRARFNKCLPLITADADATEANTLKSTFDNNRSKVDVPIGRKKQTAILKLANEVNSVFFPDNRP